MNAFIKAILSLAVISGIANSILTSSGSIKRYINYLISLIMIIVIFSPVFNVLSSFDKIKEYTNEFSHSIKTEEIINASNDLVITNTEEKICEGIKEIIISRFKFNENDVYVNLTCDKNNINSIQIKSINITLTNNASWADIDEVKQYLEDIIECEINIKRR